MILELKLGLNAVFAIIVSPSILGNYMYSIMKHYKISVKIVYPKWLILKLIIKYIVKNSM